jgi:hypothetical protein
MDKYTSELRADELGTRLLKFHEATHIGSNYVDISAVKKIDPPDLNLLNMGLWEPFHLKRPLIQLQRLVLRCLLCQKLYKNQF